MSKHAPEKAGKSLQKGVRPADGSRIRFITYRNKQILLVDMSDCPASEIEKNFRVLPDVVMTYPRGSVSILSDFAGASFDEEAVRVIKETAIFNKAYVRKSAWTGKAKVPPVLSEDFAQHVSAFSRREFPGFKTREEALLWLTSD